MREITVTLITVLLCARPAAAQDCASQEFKSACDKIYAFLDANRRTCADGTRLPDFSATASAEASRQRHLAFAKTVQPVFEEFYKAWGTCFEQDKARDCALDKFDLATCRGKGDLTQAIAADRAKLKDEVSSRDRSIAEKVQKQQWAEARSELAYVVNQLEFHLRHDPDNAFIKESLARLRAHDVELGGKEAAVLKTVVCPPGKNPNPKLAGALKGVLNAWFVEMGIQERVLVLRMNGAATAKTDGEGTKWQFVETVGCIEQMAEHLRADPTRCRIYTTTFKRSMPRGGGWSQWTWDGFLGDKPKILCDNAQPGGGSR